MTIKATADLTTAGRLEFYSRTSESGCRLWTGNIDHIGYGRLQIGGMQRSGGRPFLLPNRSA